MRNFQFPAVLVLVLLAAPNAWGLIAAANSECVEGTHVITVSGYYIEEWGGEIIDGEISGLVFECQAIGICEPSFFFPETPLAFEPQPNPGSWPVFEAECTIAPPFDGVPYRYIPFGVRPDGSLVSTSHNCDADQRSYALASCEDIPITRGVLEIESINGDDIYFHIDPCDSDCWSEDIWAFLDIARVEELSGQAWDSLLGQVIDVFGSRTYCTMPGGDYHDITRIALSSAGNCGPVPTEEESWGSLKAMYR